MYKISILTIGDEICIGQVTNTNASFIASQCTLLGANVWTHSIIGDEKKIMISELNRLMPLSDMIIITGGLGPTHDDITKPVLCEYFNDELILHSGSLKNIESILQKRGIALSERNKGQAMLPSQCIPLKNELGTAPGMLFIKNNKYIVSLPGVPSEMKGLMEQSVLPLIRELIISRKDNVVLYKNLQVIGIAESMLADLIGEPNDFLNGGTLAFLPSYKGIRLRIGVYAKTFSDAKVELERIEKIIYTRAGKYIYGTGEESLSSVIGKLLIEKHKTLAVAESCTGGLLGAEITNISGSSAYFQGGVIAYSNDVKINSHCVDKVTIEKHGAVSKETALELAKNVRAIMGTDFGISITGIAGPNGGTPEKPVGTVWIGLSYEDKTEAKLFNYLPDRTICRERAIGNALSWLYSELVSMK